MDQVIFQAFGVEIIRRGGGHFIAYDAGAIVVQTKELPISESDARRAQASVADAYRVILRAEQEDQARRDRRARSYRASPVRPLRVTAERDSLRPPSSRSVFGSPVRDDHGGRVNDGGSSRIPEDRIASLSIVEVTRPTHIAPGKDRPPRCGTTPSASPHFELIAL